MSYTIKPKAENFVRVLLTLIVLFNAIVPTTALAMPPSSSEPSALQSDSAGNSLPVMKPVYYHPNGLLSTPNRFSPQADEQKPIDVHQS
jgi:hypothetical protein